MPEEKNGHSYSFLKREDWLTFEEIIRLTKCFLHLGVNKVRLTGGEPLLREDIAQLIEKLAELSQIQDLALTTNGLLLAQKAVLLKSSGLKRLTVSLDTLDSRTFQRMSGNRGSIERVLDGIEKAEAAGFVNIKINVVIQKDVNDFIW